MLSKRPFNAIGSTGRLFIGNAAKAFQGGRRSSFPADGDARGCSIPFHKLQPFRTNLRYNPEIFRFLGYDPFQSQTKLYDRVRTLSVKSPGGDYYRMYEQYVAEFVSRFDFGRRVFAVLIDHVQMDVILDDVGDETVDCAATGRQ